MEFYCMKFLSEVALLKFTGWINDFKGSFKWLQYGWSVTWQACCFSSFTSVGCIHQPPAFQKSLHSSKNGSSRLLYAHWMMFLDRFSVIIFVYFVFFSCKTTTYELGFGDLVLFSKSKIQRICVSGGGTFQIFRGSFMMSDLNARYLFNCVFFRSLFPPKLQVFLRPIEARSKDRLLWTLKRSRDNPSPSFFSLHMNFSTSSLYSVVFVVAFVFFSDCLACRALRFTRRPAKCRICCKQVYLLPRLLYSTHDWFLVVIFDANSCYLHLFSKLFLAKTTSCQVTDWTVSSTSVGYIAATQSSCKNC